MDNLKHRNYSTVSLQVYKAWKIKKPDYQKSLIDKNEMIEILFPSMNQKIEIKFNVTSVFF